jgi:nucleolar complex protein 3
MECLDMLFKKRKQISTQRILAFMKRMCTMSLTTDATAALGLLVATRSFLQAYPKSEQLLDSDAALTGVFLADIEDPDLSNASSTTLWEVYLLQHHVDAQIASYAHHVTMGAPSTGKGALPSDMVKRELCEVVRYASEIDWRHAFPKLTTLLDHLKEEHRIKDKPLLHPERFVISTSVDQIDSNES